MSNSIMNRIVRSSSSSSVVAQSCSHHRHHHLLHRLFLLRNTNTKVSGRDDGRYHHFLLQLNHHHHHRYCYYSTTTTTTFLHNNNNNNNKYKYIPNPTWSIEDLQLTSNHPKLSKDEIQRLSHRSLIYVDDDQDNDDDNNKLEQDLANMMHMIEMVSSSPSDLLQDSSLSEYGDDDNDNTKSHDEFVTDSSADASSASGEIYDTVRGVTEAPLRRASSTTDNNNKKDDDDDDDHELDDDEQEEAISVWESQLQPNTTKIGGSHEYFVITTKTTQEQD